MTPAGNGQDAANRITTILYNPITAWLLSGIAALTVVSWIFAVNADRPSSGLLGAMGLDANLGFLLGLFGALGGYRNGRPGPVVLGLLAFAVGAVLFVLAVIRWLG
ncbi:hypothetical protein ACF3NT_14285 [Naumannella halotolerans]|uniref:Uncharacterized protein n=1 Tax=Naumannella halotolerans TaxID=993414 RepID=A0A4R7J0L6_9ACTN|nr:hypothetical protein [Naumannella halotolerans]TDT29837.1 hypothetical protein CLV29_2858 [Naumannella halotolerans]